MNKIIFLAFTCLFFQSLYAQEFSGSVFDTETKTPIRQAQIVFIDLQVSILTDSLGHFSYKSKFAKQLKVKVVAHEHETQLLFLSADSTVTILLTPSHHQLEEITVSSGNNEQKKNAISAISVKKMSELKLIPSSSLGEALSNIPGVYNASTGNGVSKPVIRGLQGMRVVSYLNGLRVENQQWAGDHGTGLTDLGIDQVEVVKGPSSLQYGSDALGGVLIFLDENYTHQGKQEGKVVTQFETNSKTLRNQIDYKISKNKFRFQVAARQTTSADFKLADGKYAFNTRYNSQEIKTALSFNTKKSISHLRFYYSQAGVGIPGETEDSLIMANKFRTSIQERKRITPMQGINNQFYSFENKFFLKKSELQLNIGSSSNHLREFEENFDTAAMNLRLNNYLLQSKWTLNVNKRNKLIWGVQTMYQQNRNGADAEEFLLPNADTKEMGSYLLLQHDWKKWVFQGGLRYDYRKIKSLDTTGGFSKLSKEFNQLNYSLGAIRSSKNSLLRLTFSNGYRTPHYTELLSKGEHHGTMRYEIGNQNLTPELASQLDLSYDFSNEHIGVSVNPYYSVIEHFIYLNPLDSIIDGLQVYQYEQKNKVFSYGGDFAIHYHPHFAHFMHLESSFSWIEMTDDSKKNLPLMPQNRLQSSLRLNINKGRSVGIKQVAIQHLYYAAQHKIASFETASAMFNVVNVSADFYINKKKTLLLNMACKNVFNVNYVDHLSRLKNIGLANSGRNFVFSLQILFDRNLKKHY